MGKEFTKEQFALIMKERDILSAKMIEILKTKPYAEGVNESFDIFDAPNNVRDISAFAELYFLEQTMNCVLKWLGDIVRCILTPKEEKEMRTNQCIFLCLMIPHGLRFRHSFEKYVAPLIVSPYVTEQEMVDTIVSRVHSLGYSQESKDIDDELVDDAKCFILFFVGKYISFDFDYRLSN